MPASEAPATGPALQEPTVKPGRVFRQLPPRTSESKDGKDRRPSPVSTRKEGLHALPQPRGSRPPQHQGRLRPGSQRARPRTRPLQRPGHEARRRPTSNQDPFSGRRQLLPSGIRQPPLTKLFRYHCPRKKVRHTHTKGTQPSPKPLGGSQQAPQLRRNPQIGRAHV